MVPMAIPSFGGMVVVLVTVFVVPVLYAGVAEYRCKREGFGPKGAGAAGGDGL